MLILSLFTGIVAGALAAVGTLLAGHGLAWAAVAYVGSGMAIMIAGSTLSLISGPFLIRTGRQQAAS